MVFEENVDRSGLLRGTLLALSSFFGLVRLVASVRYQSELCGVGACVCVCVCVHIII